MKTTILLLILALIFSLSGYGQNTRELLEKNKVKHLTITKWEKTKDGVEKRSGDMKRFEQDYDSNGNMIDRILFITFRENKSERITYKYDEENRPTEIVLYRFNDNNSESYVVEKQIREYDKKDNVIFYSLYQGTDDNPKVEYAYSYQYDDEKLIGKLTKLTNSKGVQEESVMYKYDKKGNLILETFSISSDVKYDLKYYKKSDQIQERMRYGGASIIVESFDEKGNLIKIDNSGKITFFSYNDKGKIIEQIEKSQSSITGPVYYTLTYDNEDRLIEKVGSLKSGTLKSTEKWTFNDNGLLIEYTNGSEIDKYEYEYYE